MSDFLNDFLLDDPHDLTVLVAGFLYVSGHFDVRLDERAFERALPAAANLLRAFGITPTNTHGRL